MRFDDGKLMERECMQKETTIAVIDFETTGVVPGFPEEPWQVGLAFVRNGCVDPEYKFSSLLRVEPGRPFNPYAPGRYAGVRDELASSPSLAELWPQLAPWLEGRPVMAHNVGVEKKMLSQAFPLHQFGPWVDTLALARKAFPKAKSHKLEDLLETLKLDDQVSALCPGMQPHDALYDAVASGLLFEYLMTLPQFKNFQIYDGLGL
jgi:DNA polymerase-3 subunit epsilon